MKRVLVANRGEIAVRVIRACREHGLEAVAVYADADATAPHVGLADAAVRLEGDPPTGAYLNMDGLIEAARASGADAIHPGYGFLSENADFAERIDRAGLRFVGPPPAAIRTMGDKVASRRAMADAGVPIMPGTEGQSENLGALVKAAKDIPLPLMVKAAGGGGGKGMRIVRSARDLDDAVRAASREAAAAFGNGTVYVERFIERPRHIEVQVLADAHGRTLSVLERECSIQRRHQKIVEECPSPFVTPALRKEMSEAAVAAAEAVGYVNAGTVEFLVDEDGAFYFLEMNTRIQVEHPVTEAVTGLDLVRWQLRIAAGERLPFKQSDIAPRGHAIECRVYAEDPAQKFMPSTGVIARLRAPSGPGVRVDGGIYEGYTVTPHFDPLLAKIVTWGADREAARVRMLDALAETVILGVQTTVPFLRDVLAHEAFAGGDTTTDFIPVHLPEWGTSDEDVPDAVLAAAALVESEGRSPVVSAATSAPPSPWSRIGAWRIGGA